MAQPVPRPFMVSYQTVNGNACRRFVASGAKEAVLKAIKQIPHAQDCQDPCPAAARVLWTPYVLSCADY
jgi:hypothetical protein